MHLLWIPVGRFCTDGDPFLAVDAALRGAWRGFSGDDYEHLIALGPNDTSVPVGTGRAVPIGDPVVRDDSWIEVFTSQDGRIAVVQASGPDYTPRSR